MYPGFVPCVIARVAASNCKNYRLGYIKWPKNSGLGIIEAVILGVSSNQVTGAPINIKDPGIYYMIYFYPITQAKEIINTVDLSLSTYV